MPPSQPYSVPELQQAVLDGAYGPLPQELAVTSAFWLHHTTRLAGSQVTYRNQYLLLRSGDAFGACSFEAGEVAPDFCADASGHTLDTLVRHESAPVRIAALDAYLGRVQPHRSAANAETVILPTGTPEERAQARDAAVAGLLDIAPGAKVALIGVVNPLVAAIREQGGTPLPCDFNLRTTNWGDPVTDDMDQVWPRPRGRRHRHDPRQRQLRPDHRTLPQAGPPPGGVRPDRQRGRARLPGRRRDRAVRRTVPLLPVQRRRHRAVPVPGGAGMSSETKHPAADGTAGSAQQPAEAATNAAESANAVPGDWRMTRVLWPFMLASAVGLVPFTIYSTFLVPIADTADGSVAALGQLRGLGGLAALAVGTALAPLVDRVRKEWAAAGGLAVLALSAAFGATGEFLLLTAFCLLVAPVRPCSIRR